MWNRCGWNRCISLKLLKKEKGSSYSNLAELHKEDNGCKSWEDKAERTASGQDALFLKRM